jgi:hypothetical protein
MLQTCRGIRLDEAAAKDKLLAERGGLTTSQPV